MSNTISYSTFLFCILFSSVILNFISGSDILRANQSISDGNTTIVSAGGHFEFGFVSPGSSEKRYVGIWYKKISKKTIVWIANRETPLVSTTSGLIKLDSKGNFVVLNASKYVLWTSNSSKFVKDPVLQLLDSGNLVIREENDSDPENFAWQSFDVLGNPFMPGAKLGWNLETGVEWYETAWKSVDDPSPSEYTVHIDRDGFPQIMIKKGSAVLNRGGPWNGLRFSANPNLRPNPFYKFDFVFDDKELYYHYTVVNASVVTRLTLNSFGSQQRWIWIEKFKNWTVYLTGQMNDCDLYKMCGPNGICNIHNIPACDCLDGFEPNSQKEWDVADWSSGCARKVQLSCADGEGFVRTPGLVLPDTKSSWFDRTMSLGECRTVCLKNCSCSAYANTDIRGSGSGCLLWFNELIDIRQLSENGQDLYIRMAASELANSEAKAKRSKSLFIVIPTLFIATIMLGISLWLIRKKKKRTEGSDDNLELPLFDFTTLSRVTNGFSTNCKLGEGGFGPVYKGMLDDGREIAVKRLSKNSRQGLKEFKNEVSCIAQLQHRNLVKILGCSMEEGEKLLVYEYMPNKSLDLFIFDIEQRQTLDWPMRYNIIKGIARGLLYLHQDSRLRIIHRDLKASNVLLDHEMNPKISDFGTARICQETDSGANTTRVVGTYGYMSPEYAIEGIFSVKSDVYSFGVLLLEIVCGKRIKNITYQDHHLNLLGHAWKTYTNGRVLDLVDEVMAESSYQHEFEVIRAIQIGLLCVQHYSDDRPTMATVVSMLTSSIPLPQPNQPGFFTERNLHEKHPFPSSMPESSSSSNHLSVTSMDPR